MTLYILRALHTGRIKVGISDFFHRRLSAIRRGNSEEIEVLRAYQDNDSNYIRQLERELHEELEGVCEHQEWFAPGSEVEAVINRLDRQFSTENSSQPV